MCLSTRYWYPKNTPCYNTNVAVYYVTGVVMFGGGEVCAYLPDTGILETLLVIILMLMFTMSQVW